MLVRFKTLRGKHIVHSAQRAFGAVKVLDLARFLPNHAHEDITVLQVPRWALSILAQMVLSAIKHILLVLTNVKVVPRACFVIG